jgi:predicted NBD/HSP70 family sugar kinase
MSHEHTARALRLRNRSSVLRAMLRSGATTRNRLAHELGLSAGTITNLIGDLTDEGLLQEAGQLPSDGGRPTSVVSVAPGGAYFLGADVGESGVAVELFDLSLEPIARTFEEAPSRSATAVEIAEVLAQAIEETLAQAPDSGRVYGVGLGVPGIVEGGSAGTAEPSGPITIYAQSLGWDQTGLESICARPDLPIFVDNGAKTLAAAESWFGAGVGTSDSLTILHGRGLGAGIISGGRFLHGAVGSAGEWGHTKVSIGGPQCNCGQRGCLEAYVGGAALALKWRDASGSDHATAENLVAELLGAEAAGNPVATTIVAEAVEILGVGVSNLVNIFNPDRVILGGWAGLLLTSAHLETIELQTRSASLQRPGGQFDMVAAQLGSDGVALGAALLAVEGLIAMPATGHVERARVGATP